MPLWTTDNKKEMAKDNNKKQQPAKGKQAEAVGAEAKEMEVGDKPLPAPFAAAERPGTSGTEMLLVTKRRNASERLQAAERAERTYKAKKRSAQARADMSDAAGHLGEAARHARKGLALSFGAVRLLRYLVVEKAEDRRARADEKKRQRALEKRKKLEDRLAKENAAATAGDGGETVDGDAEAA